MTHVLDTSIPGKTEEAEKLKEPSRVLEKLQEEIELNHGRPSVFAAISFDTLCEAASTIKDLIREVERLKAVATKLIMQRDEAEKHSLAMTTRGIRTTRLATIDEAATFIENGASRAGILCAPMMEIARHVRGLKNPFETE